MDVYIILLICVLVSILFQKYTNKFNTRIKKSINIIISLFLLLVLVGVYSLRDNIGYDYAMYIRTIEEGYANDIYASKGEIFSAALLNFAGFLGEPHIYFFLVALISFILIIYSLNKYIEVSNGLGWGILCFLAIPIGFIVTLDVQRQFVAMAILVFATRYLILRSFIKYFFCIVLACFFHISSIFYICIYFITSSKFKYKYFIILLLFGYIISYIGVNLLVNIFPFYEEYLTTFSSEGGFLQITVYVVWGIIFLGIKKYMKNYYNYNIFLKTYLWGLIMIVSLMPLFNSVQVVVRLGGVALMNLIFLIPYLFYAFKNYKWMVEILTILILSFMYIYALLVTVPGFFIPYKTFM